MKHEYAVARAMFSADGERILSWSGSIFGSGEVRLWRGADGQPVGAPMKHDGSVVGAMFSADGERILSWSRDGTARLWRATDGQPMGAPMKHEGEVLGTVFSADGERILSWSGEGAARLWSAANSQLMAVFRHKQSLTFACFDQGEQHVLAVRRYGPVALWDISFDARIAVQERVVEFEARSASTLGLNGEVRVLSESEWTARKERLHILIRKLGTN